MEQARLLRGFITTNTLVDHVELAHAVVGIDVDIEKDGQFPLVWLALAWVGDELYAIGTGFSDLDALCNLAAGRLFRGTLCPNCNKAAVMYDGLSEAWTFGVGTDFPWAEHACPIFFDDEFECWHRACMKREIE
jgi:hypothetical protein